MRTCVIFNPSARGEKARRMRRHLDEIGTRCALKLTWAEGTARGLAAEAVREGYEVVVAAGGDGTLNEVLNGIADVPGGLESARLGLLPLGTVNVFARELGIPIRLSRAWEVILRGRERSIDLPMAEFLQDEDGTKAVRRFAQLGGAGLDAQAIRLVDWPLKKRIGPLAYVVAGLKAMRGPHPEITVATHAGSFAGQLVLIGNGRFYGGRHVLFPDARLDDGVLDVCVFPCVGWKSLVQAGLGLATRTLHRSAGAIQLRAPAFALEGSGAAFELDGELAGQLPVSFRIDSRKLRVVVP